MKKIIIALVLTTGLFFPIIALTMTETIILENKNTEPYIKCDWTLKCGENEVVIFSTKEKCEILKKELSEDNDRDAVCQELSNINGLK